MSSYSSQIQEEQQAVDRSYARLDEMRAINRSRLDAVRATGAHGSPTMRTERDSFATMYEDRLTQLRAVEDRLVFGRLDNTAGQRRYIGRIGLSDNDHEPILTDWRAEAARPFYEATPAHHGDIVLRRHITLRFREVIGIEDEILNMNSERVDQAVSSGTLTGEGALLASLKSRRTGKMTDIVATIQAEQDRIIRSDMKHTVVVQGGPGTGKTAVALHRAAYLLYTHRRTLGRSGVLIVGPSTAFLRYIDQVLPSLGETGVVSRTIGDLIPGVSSTASEEPHVAQLKGDKRMARAVANAIAARERVPADLPKVQINGLTVPMTRVDVEQAIADAHRTRQPHNKARETFVRSMLSAMCARYEEQLDYTPDASEMSNVRSMLRMNDKVRRTLNLAWLPMTGMWLIEHLWLDAARLRSYAPWLDEEQAAMLVRPKGSPLTASDIPLLDEALELLGPDPASASRANAADAARAQELQFAKDTLAQAGIGSGIVTAQMLIDNINGEDETLTSQRAASDREWTYGHIVVDEAQELTAMDWRMLMRRCPSRSFTIVGDVAQTAAMGGTRRWKRTMDPLFGEGNWTLDELTINYRNPQQVCELASRFAQTEGLYISTVKAVRKVTDSVMRITVDDEAGLAERTAACTMGLARQFIGRDGTGRVAVITPDEWIEPTRAAIRKALHATFPEDECARLEAQSAWDEQICVCGTAAVKGLEYDAVVVVEPGLIEQNAPSRMVAASDLYVAMTRPTQRLLIVRTQADEDRMGI
ncbi:HelD family protein [Bifidobacterium jacchi]|uniref:ATP-dependent DNA helicase n=1 Tax=Bifidobacterium jacchi TaxID=2490545 RepID=A0A5N5RFH0_9BIFI|nr:AAA family ATPase [Bifidobacterium jacchi]KAB5605973.1 ATP-dependent DNA helicase [Bifidobacterium jacchi]